MWKRPSSLAPGEREEGEGSLGGGTLRAFSWSRGGRPPTNLNECSEKVPAHQVGTASVPFESRHRRFHLMAMMPGLHIKC